MRDHILKEYGYHLRATPGGRTLFCILFLLRSAAKESEHGCLVPGLACSGVSSPVGGLSCIIRVRLSGSGIICGCGCIGSMYVVWCCRLVISVGSVMGSGLSVCLGSLVCCV